MIAPVEQAKQYRGRNAIGQIGSELDFVARQKIVRRNSENVVVNQLERRMLTQRTSSQPIRKKVVDFNGPHCGRNFDQPPGQKSQARTNLKDLIEGRKFQQTEYGVDDSFLDQKVLTQFLFWPEAWFTQHATNFFIESHKTACPIGGENAQAELQDEIRVGIKMKIVTPAALQPMITG